LALVAMTQALTLGVDSMLLDSSQSASYMYSPHGASQSSYPPTQARDMIDELVSFESLHDREYAHTHVYDVSLLERVGMDLKLSTIFHAVGWEKLFEALCSGSHLLTLEFLTTFKSFARGRNSFVVY
jgi:hypothetical protein